MGERKTLRDHVLPADAPEEMKARFDAEVMAEAKEIQANPERLQMALAYMVTAIVANARRNAGMAAPSFDGVDIPDPPKGSSVN